MFPTICSAMEEGSETAFQFFKAIHFIHSAWINGPNRNDVKLSELDQDHIHSSILVINVIKEVCVCLCVSFTDWALHNISPSVF